MHRVSWSGIRKGITPGSNRLNHKRDFSKFLLLVGGQVSIVPGQLDASSALLLDDDESLPNADTPLSDLAVQISTTDAYGNGVLLDCTDFVVSRSLYGD